MTAVDPKRSTDEYGILHAPRFVPKVPGRTVVVGGRIAAARAHIPALKERPGAWAAIAESDKRPAVDNVREAIRKGGFGDPRQWECAVRRHPETRRHVLYVRYLGSSKTA